jgi:hypothetical protein
MAADKTEKLNFHKKKTKKEEEASDISRKVGLTLF